VQKPIDNKNILEPNVQFIPGGATQNTIRVAAWMLQAPKSTAYMGCVGKDEFADTMRAACEKAGVQAAYLVDDAPTGTCATLINGIERSLCTELSAANNYKESHLLQAENMGILSSAKIVYSAGFFATVSPASMEIAAKKTVETGAYYCLNLSAPFLMQVPPFKAALDSVLPYTDFLFCNETEALTWAECAEWGTKDCAEIALKLSKLPSEKKIPRTVVITQGADPTIVAKSGEIKEYPIIALSKEKLVDTNGAGDAYVGGFLAALSKDRDVESCCKAGSYAASVIVQHSGCTFPAMPEYTF